MKCSYQIHDGVNKHSGRLETRFCPSEAHVGIMEKEDEAKVTFYCSHHRRVVEAKQTNRLYQIIKGGDK